MSGLHNLTLYIQTFESICHVMWCTIEARYCKHCCSEKAITIVYSVCVCVCSLRYPTCNAHAPYCHLWPVRLFSISAHYLINGTVFGGEKTLLDIKLGFSICQHTWSEIYLILGRIQVCIIINVHRCSCRVPVIIVIL